MRTKRVQLILGLSIAVLLGQGLCPVPGFSENAAVALCQHRIALCPLQVVPQVGPPTPLLLSHVCRPSRWWDTQR